jgi:hypothetical protein
MARPERLRSFFVEEGASMFNVNNLITGAR